MTRSQGPSVSDKLLIAAYALEASGKIPFTAEDLVVSAWRAFPDTFGLAGHNDVSGELEYPDSNRVFAEIMGSKPIRKRGLLRKVGTKMYQLTEAGRERARFLAPQTGRADTRKLSLSRGIEAELQRLLAARATDKYRLGRKDQITFRDACAFWGISPRSSAIELEGRRASAQDTIQRALQAIDEGGTTFEHAGAPLQRQDVEGLTSAAAYMEAAFSSELEVISRRRDERA
jgi:hypothetical protein